MGKHLNESFMITMIIDFVFDNSLASRCPLKKLSLSLSLSESNFILVQIYHAPKTLDTSIKDPKDFEIFDTYALQTQCT